MESLYLQAYQKKKDIGYMWTSNPMETKLTLVLPENSIAYCLSTKGEYISQLDYQGNRFTIILYNLKVFFLRLYYTVGDTIVTYTV